METVDKVSVSLHARERLGERWDWRETATLAYQEGEHLTQNEMDVLIKRGLNGDRYWIRRYKKYKNLIFVFEPPKRGKVVLVTVLPPIV